MTHTKTNKGKESKMNNELNKQDTFWVVFKTDTFGPKVRTIKVLAFNAQHAVEKLTGTLDDSQFMNVQVITVFKEGDTIQTNWHQINKDTDHHCSVCKDTLTTFEVEEQQYAHDQGWAMECEPCKTAGDMESEARAGC
jgi:acyl-ACP thioesterase